ncbi:MAG: hypothetical protein JWQ02_476 [Capsulimonas sp.]|nr:hypothetical protein [Capsulimonas sp.]
MNTTTKYSLALMSVMIAAVVSSARAQAGSKPAAVTSTNAYRYFVDAGAAMDVKGDELSRALGGDGPGAATTALTPAQRDDLVRRNAKALRLLRQGFAFSFTPPQGVNGQTPSGFFSEMAKFRALARLLRVEAQSRAAHGNWGGAANSDLDAVQLGEMCVRGGSVIAELVGNAVQAIGRVDLWDKIGHLNAAQSRQAIARMDRIARLHTPLADVLHQEEREYLAQLKVIFHQPDWRSKFADQIISDKSAVALLSKIDQKTITQGYTSYMDKLAAATRRPYSKAHLEALQPSLAVLSFAAISAPTVLFDANARTQNALLRATLGLRIYQSEHGRYPKTFAALTPAILRTPATDPFSGAPLRYRLSGATYVLYSVGPDGRDDRGKAITDPHPWLERARHRVDRNSQGDIVAGVNKG